MGFKAGATKEQFHFVLNVIAFEILKQYKINNILTTIALDMNLDIYICTLKMKY